MNEEKRPTGIPGVGDEGSCYGFGDLDVEMLAGSLKYGVRTPAEAYMRRAYGHVTGSLGQ